jgi:ubiquinone/menaquinone biosynthesis C-methylase UbiE
MPASNKSDVIQRYYETDDNLRIRQETHDKYTVPKNDFPRWVLETVNWNGDETILDLGAGIGTYYSRLLAMVPNATYHAIDISHKMLKNHPAPSDFLTLSNAMYLPYSDDSFDVVMANHMLYHVSNIDAALKEIRRVLKPNGKVLIATNSIHTMPELQVLMRRAIVLLTRYGATQVRPPALPSDSFALENGTRILAQHFFAVVRHDNPGQLVFTEIEPAITYLESMRELRQDHLPEDVAWEDMMLIMRQQITQLIKHLGKLEINKMSGALIASDSGGFIHEFVDRDTTTRTQ